MQITEIDFYQLKENVEFIERILAYVIVIKADWNKLTPAQWQLLFDAFQS